MVCVTFVMKKTQNEEKGSSVHGPQGTPWVPAGGGGMWVPVPPSSVLQALGTITAVPVTGPQVSSLQRLAGQGAAVLPQVSSLRAGFVSVCLRPVLGAEVSGGQ